MRVQDGLIRPDRVFEKLATSDKVTLTIERLPDGQMHGWVNGSLHVARKERHPDQWDVPTAPYDPYGPGVGALNNDGPVTHHSDDVMAR